jgi:hypothetical protein
MKPVPRSAFSAVPRSAAFARASALALALAALVAGAGGDIGAAAARAAALPDAEVLARAQPIARRLAGADNEWHGEIREKLWLLLTLYAQAANTASAATAPASDSQARRPDAVAAFLSSGSAGVHAGTGATSASTAAAGTAAIALAEANTRLAALLAGPVEPYTQRHSTWRFTMFTASDFTLLLDHFAHLMPPPLRDAATRRLAEIVGYIDTDWEPRHASDYNMGHTNYALLWLHAYVRGAELAAPALAAAGADPAAIRARAAAAFHHWCDSTLHNGITDFNATTYYKIDLTMLTYLADRAADPALRRRAAAFADFLWLDAALHYWPAQRRLAGANSRSYFIDGTGGTLNLLRHHLLAEPMDINLGDEYAYALADRRPPAFLREIALEKTTLDYDGLWLAPEIAPWRRKMPGAGEGGDDGAYGNRPGCDRTTAIRPAWTLGTGGDGYAWQDRMLVADFLPAKTAAAPLVQISLRVNTAFSDNNNNTTGTASTAAVVDTGTAAGAAKRPRAFADFLGNMRHWPLRTATLQHAGAAIVLCTMDTPPRGATVPSLAPLLLCPATADHVTLLDPGAAAAGAVFLPGSARVPRADEGRPAPRPKADGEPPSVSPRDAGAPQATTTAGTADTFAGTLDIPAGFPSREISPHAILLIEHAGARAALRCIPTPDAFAGQRPRHTLRADGDRAGLRFGTFSTILYEHAGAGPLPRRPAGKNIRAGFIVEIADAAADPDLAAFARRIQRQTRLTQTFDGTHWRVDYRTADNHALTLIRDIRAGRTLAKEIDRTPCAAPVHRSTLSTLENGLLTIRWRGQEHRINLNRQ